MNDQRPLQLRHRLRERKFEQGQGNRVIRVVFRRRQEREVFARQHLTGRKRARPFDRIGKLADVARPGERGEQALRIG